MLKQNIFNKLFIAVVFLALFSTINAETIPGFHEKQVVYLADEPLPKIAARLKRENGWSEGEILEHLKNTLPKVTPELAKEKFGIKWLDNGLQNKHREEYRSLLKETENIETRPFNGYPSVAICYMGPEVGYGLFAMTNIKAYDFIADYTGKFITDKKITQKSAYVSTIFDDGNIFEGIDAEKSGNAARFAQHLISDNDLSFYRYITRVSINSIMTGNSGLVVAGFTINDTRSILTAQKNIKVFEQIGFSYSSHFGYDFYFPPIQEVFIFDGNGEIITRRNYLMYTSVIFADQIGPESLQIPPQDEAHFEIKQLFDRLLTSVFSEIYSRSGYIIVTPRTLSGTSNKRLIINTQTWKESFFSKKDRITIAAYFVDDKTNIKEFISILKETKKLHFSKEDNNKILNLAKNNKFNSAEKLLTTLKNRQTKTQKIDKKKKKKIKKNQDPAHEAREILSSSNNENEFGDIDNEPNISDEL